MKVGILSMQRVVNYGSFLQAFALQNIIKNRGDCEFIDIERGVVFPELRRTPGFLMRKAIDRYFNWDVITRIRYAKKLESRFRNEFFGMLDIDEHHIAHFDTVVIGSDEVFNFAQRVPWGFSRQLYGSVKNADKVISYAGSFGNTTWKDILHFGVGDDIAGAMGSMSAISVRDDNSSDIVERLLSIRPLKHVDPVLVFDFSPYVSFPVEEDYLIIYTYPNRIKAPKEIQAIKSFARKHNKKIISIGFYFPWADKTVIPDPFEVLGYIANADFVITDTFHGSVMSIKYNRPFVAMVRPSNRQKMLSLLSQFGLVERIVCDMDLLERKLLTPIDYCSVNALLELERTRAFQYIEENI